MYTSFYGLREKPFALSPNPRFLFLGESHREALAHLLYGIEQGEGFIAITGEVGTGKTTLCRTLLERLGSDTEVAFLFNPSRSGTELLQTISLELGLPAGGLTRRELGDQLNRYLLTRKKQGRRVLLIVDESQNLSSSTLEQIRLLSNLETNTEKLLQIVLTGQPELREMLARPELAPLRQRVALEHHVEPLREDEVGDYLHHRIEVAGGRYAEIFEPGADSVFFSFSAGCPRLINLLADRALLSAFARQERPVRTATLEQKAKEIADQQARPLGGMPVGRPR